MERFFAFPDKNKCCYRAHEPNTPLYLNESHALF